MANPSTEDLDERVLMPLAFHTADRTAMLSQRRYFWWVHGVGYTGVVAAALGAFSWQLGGINVLAMSAALFFGAQLLFVLFATHGGDDKAWYDARAAAESTKTMAWRFAVGGEPFPISIPEGEAHRAFVERGRQILGGLSEILRPALNVVASPLPDALLGLRHSPLEIRQATYTRVRLEEQLGWYQRKAKHHNRMKNRYTTALVGISTVGLLGGLVHSVSTWHMGIDIAGICGAMAGALLSGTQARQHSLLARAYTVTAHEISYLLADPPSETEEQWASWVDGAEEALSREHTMWLATHGRHG